MMRLHRSLRRQRDDACHTVFVPRAIERWPICSISPIIATPAPTPKIDAIGGGVHRAAETSLRPCARRTTATGRRATPTRIFSVCIATMGTRISGAAWTHVDGVMLAEPVTRKPQFLGALCERERIRERVLSGSWDSRTEIQTPPSSTGTIFEA